MKVDIFQAIEFANKIHEGQFRKSTKIPKLVHLIGVANILLESKCKNDVVIAGLLHDSLEDTEITEKQLTKRFGSKITTLVKGASEEDKTKSWEERKKETLKKLKHVSNDIALIVCADKIDNFRLTRREYEKIGDKVWKRFNRGKKDQEWYFKSITKILNKKLKTQPGKNLAKELENEVKKVFG